jgi:hypothetical protein
MGFMLPNYHAETDDPFLGRIIWRCLLTLFLAASEVK